MKKNKKGFMLVETLVVSTLVSVVLIALYVQFNNIINNFDRDSRYNSVNNLYATQNIKNFILRDATGNFYTNLKNLLDKNIKEGNSHFLKIITNCSGNSANAYQTNACTNFDYLTRFYNVKQIIFTLDTINLLEIDYQLLSNSNLERFIRSIKNDTEAKYDENGNTIYDYRIIVEFTNNEYATLTMAN